MGHPLSIAIVGPGESATPDAIADAEAIGRLVAKRGWIALCGGRAIGVMAAAARGVRDAGGIIVGILPDRDRSAAAPDLTIALPTGLGEARNVVLVTASDAVVACGLSAGTASEVSLAIQALKPTVLVRPTAAGAALFKELAATVGGPFQIVSTPEEAIDWVARRVTDESAEDRV